MLKRLLTGISLLLLAGCGPLPAWRLPASAPAEEQMPEAEATPAPGPSAAVEEIPLPVTPAAAPVPEPEVEVETVTFTETEDRGVVRAVLRWRGQSLQAVVEV